MSAASITQVALRFLAKTALPNLPSGDNSPTNSLSRKVPSKLVWGISTIRITGVADVAGGIEKSEKRVSRTATTFFIFVAIQPLH